MQFFSFSNHFKAFFSRSNSAVNLTDHTGVFILLDTITQHPSSRTQLTTLTLGLA